MNIAIIGATGMVGARTAAEAISRGHQVDAYTRSGKAPEGTVAHSIDLVDTAALVDVVNNHDVTIVAVSAGRGTSAQPVIDAHRALIAAAPTGRLLVVGGAGSLYVNPEHTAVVADGPEFPEAFKPLAAAQGKALEELRARDDVRWTFISPAADFQADGERTGVYILAGEELRLNDAGESVISYADYAIAMVDEAERTSDAHIRQRISVVRR